MSETKEVHPLTDAFIDERWPILATPEGREIIRRQFDALMEQINNSPWKPFPRFPDAMAEVVVEKARTLPDRINGLKAALAGLPEHWRQWQWSADPKPVFGERLIRSLIVGDNGHGFGRQWIASVNHTSKSYVGTLADFIAAANPDTVSMLLAYIEQLEAERDALKNKINAACEWYWPAEDTSSDMCADGVWGVRDNVDLQPGAVLEYAIGGVFERRYFAFLEAAEDSDSDDEFEIDASTEEEVQAALSAEIARRASLAKEAD